MRAVCWECAEEFTVDEYALKDEMPKCMDCRDKVEGTATDKPDVVDSGLSGWANMKELLAKSGFNRVSSVPPDMLKGWLQMRQIDQLTVDRFLEMEKELGIEEEDMPTSE